MTRSVKLAALIFSVIASFPGHSSADSISVDITAFIDGRDQLILRGNTLQWHHFDFAAVGRHEGRNEPTVISTTLNGTVITDRLAWIPDWPAPPPDEIRFEAFSSVFTSLNPAMPSQDVSLALQPIDARSILQLVQLPAASNGFTTILEFDDNGPPSSAQYRGLLTFTFQPVPEASTLRMLCLSCVLGIGYLTWPRRWWSFLKLGSLPCPWHPSI